MMRNDAAGSGIYVGAVTRINGGEVYVKVPDIGGDTEMGPCHVAEGPWTPMLRSKKTRVKGGGHSHPGTTATEHDHGLHTHVLGEPLDVGHVVFVGFMAADPTDPVVLGRVADSGTKVTAKGDDD